MKKILIIGATSAIAQGFARVCAAEGDALFLVARNAAKLQVVAQDLRVRGAKQTGTLVADANDFSQHGAQLEMAIQALGGLDAVLIAHGVLGKQTLAERDYTVAEQEYKTNFLSVVSLLISISVYFEKQKRGTIAVITSVAGDRGRQSNYVYGSAKGALSIYLSGLRNRLYHPGVAVLDIRPGFVDTPMTAHLKKGLLFASPTKVGKDIYRAIEKKKNVLYTPWPWRWILFVIRLIPEFVFKRLSL